MLYLCDGMGCDKENKSCEGKPETSQYCMHTTRPEHAVNGACEHPEQDPERFHEIMPEIFVEVVARKFTDA